MSFILDCWTPIHKTTSLLAELCTFVQLEKCTETFPQLGSSSMAEMQCACVLAVKSNAGVRLDISLFP